MIPYQDKHLIVKMLRKAASLETVQSDQLCKEMQALRSEHPDLVSAFALTYEACRRILGFCPYEEQLYGGLVMTRGCIAQMNTGEGKTVTAVFPACYYALTGQSVQIATVNPYLAQRDCEWMQPVYELLGFRVGVNSAALSVVEKQEAYRKDIVYGTHSEFGFDYLRDHLVTSSEHKVQPPPAFMLVDEADSILLDEAVTPMILSGGNAVQDERLDKVDHFVRWLKKVSVQTIEEEEDYHELDEKYDYIVMEKDKIAILTSLGYQHATQFFPMYDLNTDVELNHLIFQSLQAHGTLRRDVDYIVEDDKLHIVDANTGRIAEGRRFCDGLWQAIQMKEHLPMVQESLTLASISYQQFFRRFPLLCGMTGTAWEERREFENVYNMPVKVVPPHRKCRRKDEPDLCAGSRKEQLQLVADEAEKARKSQQPCLIVTRSVEDSEAVAELLNARKLSCEVLNARDSAREADIIAKAGIHGTITVSTAMAGRGTDIKPDAKALKAGGLYVIGLGHQNTRRGDRQLMGRSGRQGDPGKSRFVISQEDDLFRRYGENGKTLSFGKLRKAVRISQRFCESGGRGQRKSTLQLDEIIGKYRDHIYAYRDRVLNGEITPKDTLLPPVLARAVILSAIDQMWPVFLKESELARQNCSAVSLAGRDYKSEYIHAVADTFSRLTDEMKESIDRQLHSGIRITTQKTLKEEQHE